MQRINLNFIFACLFTFSCSLAFSADENSCKGKKAGPLQAKLLERKSNLEGAMESTVKLIQQLSSSEKLQKKYADISSSITYGIVAAGMTGGVAGVGVTALSGGAASLSLRFGTYVVGSTLRTNTVGIGAELIFGGVAGTAGSSVWYFSRDEKTKIDPTAFGFSYKPVKDTFFDPQQSFFSDARGELTILQKKMAETKDTKNIFNLNNKTKLAKDRLEVVNNFFLLQLLTFEHEAVKQSLAYQALHCNSDMIYIEMNLESEKRKIFDYYSNLKDINLEEATDSLREKKLKPSSTAQ